MSIIFGTRIQPTGVVTEQELLFLAEPTRRYAPDGTFFLVSGRIGMGFQPYHTHRRSSLESAPAIDALGNMLAFDGRLDNYEDLSRALHITDRDSADASIILAAYAAWGEKCFSKLIGDWALALWDAAERRTVLARDHAGTRTLYFQNSNGTLRWSTYLETFFAHGESYSLDEEYAARYLSLRPIRDLTPYKEIRSVPPAHYLAIQDESIRKCIHWDWMRTESVRYKSDAEYDEHFLNLFAQAVLRRDEPETPILAQLSGGMDSTSIVCMSDRSRKSTNSSAELLDTISFYDDSERSWDERPYFTQVEAFRGKAGLHLATSFTNRTFEPPVSADGIYLLPGADSSTPETERAFEGSLGDRQYRVILSGIGGDEILGGKPDPRPELADYLVSGRIPRFLTRSMEWCLADRTPLSTMCFETIKYTTHSYRPPRSAKTIPLWLDQRLKDACARSDETDLTRGERIGFKPSSISNGLAWWSIMETLPILNPHFLSRREYRFPYLDRDLTEYLFSVPPEQLVRPGRRRSLMRRALRNIVPEAILERRRKAFISRGPVILIRHKIAMIERLFRDSAAADLHLIDYRSFHSALQAYANGHEVRTLSSLMKGISFELWLRNRPLIAPYSGEVQPFISSLPTREGNEPLARPTTTVGATT